jgi:hypothetical protein
MFKQSCLKSLNEKMNRLGGKMKDDAEDLKRVTCDIEGNWMWWMRYHFSSKLSSKIAVRFKL